MAGDSLAQEAAALGGAPSAPQRGSMVTGDPAFANELYGLERPQSAPDACLALRATLHQGFGLGAVRPDEAWAPFQITTAS